MDMDGLGFIILFAVVGGLIWGILADKKQSKPVDKRAKTSDNEDDLSIEDSEFDGAILFGDYLFPSEIDDLDN
jgi:hypothetical protein